MDWENDNGGIKASEIYKIFTKKYDDSQYVPDTYYDTNAIAEAVMDELVANGLEDMLILKNLEVGEWWTGVLKNRAWVEKELQKAKEKAKKEKADKLAKKELLNRLTKDEKRLLGL